MDASKEGAHHMSRFNNPAELAEWARKAAAEDHRRHVEQGHDLNPYCTPGARNEWARGFNNEPPRTYEHPDANEWGTQYQRGKAAAQITQGATA